jgi:hypothetical protein
MGEGGMVYQDEDGNMYHADDMMEGDEYGMEEDGHHDDYGMEGSPEVISYALMCTARDKLRRKPGLCEHAPA